MVQSLVIVDFLKAPGPILDVRSPGEFLRGHIPEARSLPLFNDEERAVVGTLYKQQGRDAAVLEGLRIVGPKLSGIVEQAREIAPDGRIRIHCWRGGERSGSVAWLLEKAGFTEVTTLRRGYKAFRQHVHSSFGRPLDLRILGGYTGSGKTETLRQLGKLGAQVIDLEALANHKGSSFGALGEDAQPTTEHFENLLWAAIKHVEPDRPVWLEDESMNIGRVKIPDPFFAHMRSSLLFFVEMSIADRAARLVVDYGAFPKPLLSEAIQRLEKRLGPQHCKAALEALDTGDLLTVALILLRYYDKTYLHGASQRPADQVVPMPATAGELHELAQRLLSNVERPV